MTAGKSNEQPGLDISVPAFGTTEEETKHAEWIRIELERRQCDPRFALPHDTVVRRMEERIARWTSRTSKN